MRRLSLGLLVAALASPGGVALGAFGPPADTLLGPGPAVPFVSQGPLLCGGASAAMVERFWGALGVYADDYAELVSEEDGGITTGALQRAMERRGYRVRVLRDAPEAVLRHVADGRPVIVLVESGATRYHYVVVTGLRREEIHFHDPIRAPDRTEDRGSFLRRWGRAHHWSLVATPAGAPDGEVDPGDTRADSERESRPAEDPSDSLPTVLGASLTHLRAGRFEEAEQAALPVARTSPGASPHGPLAWRMVASARYLSGDAMGALTAWNAVDEPAVDLVRVQGLDRIHYRPLVDHLGLHPGQVLTPRTLAVARRRLAQVPAVRSGRVDYRPLEDGTVRIEASILEQRPWLGPTELGGVALGAGVDQEISMHLGPFLPAGERWSLQGSWHEARRRASLGIAAPWPGTGGVVTVAGGWVAERYAGLEQKPDEESRRWARASFERWTGPSGRLGLSVGMERWSDRGRFGRIGASVLRLLGPAGHLRVEGDVWASGDDGFARVRVGAGAALPAPTRGSWTLNVGGILASGGSPALVWSGAGVGRIRAPLLRGHPLSDGDRIRGPAFGPGLLHGTLSREFAWSLGPLSVGVGAFVDVAHAWDGPAPGPVILADPGVELRLGALDRGLAVSLARGEGEWVLSARSTAR